MEKSNAEIKDDILQFLVNNISAWTVDTLYTKLQNPTPTVAHFEKIVKEMISDGGQYFNYTEGEELYLRQNDFTQEFLNNGGFTKASKIAAANTAATVIELQEEKEAKRVTREKDREQLTIVKWQKNTFWIVFVLGLVGGVYSLYKISQAIFIPSNNVTEEQLNPKIDSIQNRLERLEKDLKQVDRLKSIDSAQTTK
ncbi:hypothetical protein [Arenibacter palladensis]|uniref:hypothetical protein n=1 Tax=Arenibacter palladensis TaxID=237373 RepID=UPI0026E21C32|nr:hypothetical protein [Arenibacter palladensis]MDO6602003.1 hypothetical protein [Arenibacter palladensis]